jgi:signal transduction histidine kinase
MSIPDAPRNPPPDAAPRPGFGLSARLLILTILFVMLAEVLIYVPSVANFRKSWLNDRLAAAQVAALVFETVPEGGFPSGFEAKLLAEVGVIAVAARVGGQHRLISASPMPPSVSRTVDLRDPHWLALIADAFTDLTNVSAEPLRIVGPGMSGAEQVEMIVASRPLRDAMLTFSRNILLLSLLISAITAALVFLTLNVLIVRPVRIIADNVMRFESDPEDGNRVIAPSARTDEIGLVERALARMEMTLAREFRQKKHLAALGLAVSKINHDLRNMLATAQLFSDRLSGLADPTAQRFAPKLIATLGRAIDFCQATLAYGRAVEPAPKRSPVLLKPIVAEAADLAGVTVDDVIAFDTDVPADLKIDADAEQLSRILSNLLRNAGQALVQAGASEGMPRLTVHALRNGAGVAITVADNGPGVPAAIRERLFDAFHGSTRAGGSGLGLAIAAELVQQHGGRIALADTEVGSTFELFIPDRKGG